MKISVIMPSFNQARYVEAALTSVLSQDYEDFEVLYIDGGSTDGTMQIVEKYRDRLAVIRSARDNGQSDAMRTGFSLATGDILTWMNTDDLLLPGALSAAARAFSENPTRSWLLGNVIWIDSDDNILKCWRGESYTPGWMKLGLFSSGGPSAFFRRDLYFQVGGIDIDMHYQMDTDLWWRFAMAGARYHRLTSYIWALRLHKDAKVSGHMFSSKADEQQHIESSRQRAEQEKIRTLTSRYIFPLPKFLRQFLALFRKATSPSFAAGLLHTLRFSQRPLTTFVKFHSTKLGVPQGAGLGK